MQFDFNWENKLYIIKNLIIFAALTGTYYVLEASVPKVN